jgi:hypothetical protein
MSFLRLVPQHCLFAAIIGWGFACGTCDAAIFRAAAAKVEITPETSLPMWGYSSRAGNATGKLDPLFAKVLVLDDESTRLALVTLDLGRTFHTEQMEALRKQVRETAGVHQVFFFASHTHSGPVFDHRDEAGKPHAWYGIALDQVAGTIQRAAEDLTPVRIGTGVGETYIGHNRRHVQEDGSVKMLWRNLSKIPTRPLDPRVGVIRVDRLDGTVLALLVNYACHPVVLGPDNLQYSADYPGAMAKLVEESFDGPALCLFLQGGAGDINPYYDKMALGEDAVRVMQQTGEQLGQEVVRVGREINTRVPDNAGLKLTIDTLPFKMRWNTERLLAQLKSRLKPDLFKRYEAYLQASPDCPVTVLLINDEIALMGMPGEPFVDFAIDFRARSPLASSFFAGYANGYKGYFPTIEAAVAGGYGADSVGARIEVGAGEAMVDHAIVTLYKMQLRLSAEPER